MKQYQVIFSDQAETDMREIFEYIADELHAPDSAAKLLYQLENRINNLAFFPESYQLYDGEPWHSRNLRVMSAGNYHIFYVPDSDRLTVTIIRIFSERMDVKKQLTSSSFFQVSENRTRYLDLPD